MVKVCSCLRGKSMSPGEYGRNKKIHKINAHFTELLVAGLRDSGGGGAV